MNIIEINKRFYTIPTSWNELSQRQLLDMMDILFVQSMTGEMALLKMIKVLCGMSYYHFYKAKVDEMAEYFYLLDGLLNKKNELTKNIFPDYEGYYGPADELTNIIMEEFVFTEDFYMHWRGHDDDESLNMLVAALYRRPKRKYDFAKNPDGDARVAFNENICSFNAKNIICNWGRNFKLAVATWYEGCRTKLVEDNPEVFGGNTGGDPLKYGLLSVIRSIAKNGVLGNFNEVEKKYVNLVLIELNESIAEGKELEKQLKQQQHG